MHEYTLLDIFNYETNLVYVCTEVYTVLRVPVIAFIKIVFVLYTSRVNELFRNVNQRDIYSYVLRVRSVCAM